MTPAARPNPLGPRAALVALVPLLLLALVLPRAALAAPGAEVSIMDDQLLLGRSQRFIDRQMAIFQSLGVDRVRVSAFWNAAAPQASSRRKPRGFDAANPFDPRYAWGALDRVVSSAVDHGFKVMISITTPAPLWATGRPRGRNPLWRPNPRAFGAFAEAVARRYGRLVDQYGISNEPNQGGWLQPQSDRTGLVSPHLYREMVLAAYPRIKAADPTSVALVGNLAPRGRARAAAARPPDRSPSCARWPAWTVATAPLPGVRVVTSGRYRPTPSDIIPIPSSLPRRAPRATPTRRASATDRVS